MSDEPLTIREHLEAIRDQHFRAVYRLGLCRCGEDYPCSNREHAAAALDLTAEAEKHLRALLTRPVPNAVLLALEALVGKPESQDDWKPHTGKVTGHCQTCGAPNHGGYITPGCPDCIHNRVLATDPERGAP